MMGHLTVQQLLKDEIPNDPEISMVQTISFDFPLSLLFLNIVRIVFLHFLKLILIPLKCRYLIMRIAVPIEMV
jgi:hypothetical protein